MSGLLPLLGELRALKDGICPACGATLRPGRTRGRQFTCDEHCHAVWVDRIVDRHGETREIIDARTGKVHLVPTRVILEDGIAYADLPTYPEKKA